ncbi:PhnA domain-containing protein [Pelagibaculum spongiae]|uniref:PhnA domain protein n=1 Tax=Pelagibaculum spongiae TaxID=2080658 RepID=A0A2V1GWW0_9GAMM|nr:alkylphosphonate utilization protein [Pelagibaculum spongiae]PVZ63918.1 PhnA domain protein [Pelagibaculum spongiae]
MSIEASLQARSEGRCELCTAETPLNQIEVSGGNGTADDNVAICAICEAQTSNPESIDGNHWRCLNDSMWSQVPAVQVMAWRQLRQLVAKGEGWAQDLLDMLYLDEDMQKWAESGLEDENATPTKDSNGARLQAGDSVTLIKDLTVKGAGFTAKRGTLVKNISLTDNPLHIEGKVNGTQIVLVSAYLKKA